MKRRKWQVSYLSNVLDLRTTGERPSRVFTTLADNLAVYCVEEDGWYRPVEFELPDGAETLLPHLLPEEFKDAWDWMPIGGTPQVHYDRERDLLWLFNHEAAAVVSRPLADYLSVGCDEKGRPVSVEITGAAELLLPYLLPLSEEVTPINLEVNQ